MRIAIHYPHVHLQKRPTGVGKHMLNMTLGLAARPDCEVSLLTSRHGLDDQGRIPQELPTAGLPVNALHLSDNLMHRLWKYTGVPSADLWCRNADWIYAPGETYVATAKARFASSVHAIHFFDRNYAEYGSAENARARVRWRFHLDRVFRKASLVCVPSDFLRDRLAELYPTRASEIVTVGNGIEEAFFLPSQAARGDSAAPYLIAVGGLHDIKGANELLALAAELQSRAPAMRLVVVGPNDPKHQRTAETFPNIVLKGYMRVEDGLPQLMQDALAALVLSRYETFGIPALEAMAVGTPVIASRVGALPQTVGDAAILCDPQKTSELADIVLHLSLRQSARNDLIVKGRARADSFHWTDCVSRLVDAFHNRS